MSKHLKRMAMPSTWPLERKGSKFVTKPNPGPHSLEYGIALNSVLKEMLNYAHTSKEVKSILGNGWITIDGKVRKDLKFPVGLMDVLKNLKSGEAFRMMLNSKGKLELIKIPKSEENIKPCKIIRKQMVKGGKIQITLHDGRNLLTENKEYNVGDSLMIELPSGKPLQHLTLKKGSFVFITDGKHAGEFGRIVEIIGEKSIQKTRILVESNGQKFETLTEYAFVIGEEKPLITITQ
ncbi:MAG: 30S ribosomal protein S4e [Candidatus Woesearchaeota archaeon]